MSAPTASGAPSTSGAPPPAPPSNAVPPAPPYGVPPAGAGSPPPPPYFPPVWAGPVPPPGAPPFAGIVERAVAIVIDSILIGIVAFVLVFVVSLSLALGGALVFGLGFGIFSGFYFLLAGVFFLLTLLYFCYFESRSGQTPGKQLMHIRVIDPSTGRSPDLTKSLLRNLLRIIDGLAFYLVGAVFVLITDRKQRLGDMIAGTIVVRA